MSSIRKTSTKILFSSKVSAVLLSANLLVITLRNQNTFYREQWLVHFVKHSVQKVPKAYLEHSHTSKMEFMQKS